MSEVTARLPLDWDFWLAEQGVASGFCQTTAWARIHAAVNGAASYVLSVNRGGKRVAGALVSLRPAGTIDSLSKRLRRQMSGNASGVLECFEGPVLTDGVSFDDVDALLTEVRELAQQLGTKVVRFSGPPPLARWAGDASIGNAFRGFGYSETPWLTCVVDLTNSEDVLLSQLRQAARKGIRKSKDAKLFVRICDSFDDYEKIFCTAYYETSIAPQQLDGFWQADCGRAYRFFVVQDESGAVHATLGTYRYQGVATEILSRRTAIGQTRNFPAQDLLHWEAMLYHKSIGDSFFNFAGYSPAPTDDKEAGIRRFKEKWGGEERSVPIFTWVHTPPLMRAGRWLKAKVTTA